MIISRTDDRVTVEISDDGRGGADPAHGSGLSGLADRVQALDGELTIQSPDGVGTTVRARFIIRPQPADRSPQT